MNGALLASSVSDQRSSQLYRSRWSLRAVEVPSGDYGPELHPESLLSLAILVFFLYIQSRISSAVAISGQVSVLRADLKKVKSQILSGVATAEQRDRLETEIGRLEAQIEQKRTLIRINEKVVFRLRLPGQQSPPDSDALPVTSREDEIDNDSQIRDPSRGGTKSEDNEEAGSDNKLVNGGGSFVGMSSSRIEDQKKEIFKAFGSRSGDVGTDGRADALDTQTTPVASLLVGVVMVVSLTFVLLAGFN